MGRDEFKQVLGEAADTFNINLVAKTIGVEPKEVIQFFQGYDICKGNYQTAADQLMALANKAKIDG